MLYCVCKHVAVNCVVRLLDSSEIIIIIIIIILFISYITVQQHDEVCK